MGILFNKGDKVIYVNSERCKGCGFCMEVCPAKVLEPSKELNARGVFPPVMKAEGKCNLCTLCEYMCPDLSIYIIKKPS